MINSSFFSKKIILLDKDADDASQAIEKVVERLELKKVVTSDFLKAVLWREKEYPTGLQLENNLGVAIPHTDPDKVLQNQIGIIRLNNSVKFRQMGSATDIVDVRIIFVLCLKEAHEQLDMLQTLMGMFADKDILEQLMHIQDGDTIVDLLTNN